MKNTITILLFVILSKITFAQINTNSFETKVDYISGTGTSNPQGIVTADLDNDGKNDMISGNIANSSISIFRNISNSTSINFDTKVDYSTLNPVNYVHPKDLDGDGKVDLIISSNTGSSFSIFRNTTSNIGSITFGPRQDIVGLSIPSNFDIDDVDGDSKIDLICTNYNSSSFSVYRNTSTIGTISFATKIDYTCGSSPTSVCVVDLDGDNKKDIAITLYTSSQIVVFKNTTTSIGSPTFTNGLYASTGSYPNFIKCADLDGDGKKDLVTSNFYGYNISIIKNTSTSVNAISFQNTYNISSGSGVSYCQGISLSDFDNDNRIDIGVCNRGNDNISVFKNISTSGTFNATSFAPQVFFSVNTAPTEMFASDLNGDGKLEILVANNGSNNISILKNKIIPSIAPTNFKYNDSIVVATRTITNINSSATYAGDPIVSFSITPSLPTGVSLNTSTGLISGIPTVNIPQTLYTITGTNSGGSTNASFSLIVSSALAIKDIKTNIFSNISFKPNPFINNIEIDFISTTKEAIKLIIIDATGKEVYTKTIQSNIGSNNLLIDELSYLNTGVYTARLVNNNGLSDAFKIVKN